MREIFRVSTCHIKLVQFLEFFESGSLIDGGFAYSQLD